MSPIPSFEAWQGSADKAVQSDAVWKVAAYRLALYAVEIGWQDVMILDRARVTRPSASQLYRALGSISANIAEAYSRSSGVDRARILEYGLGSARESVAWYFAGRPVLGRQAFEIRTDVLSQVRRLLLTTIQVERNRGRLRQRNRDSD
jgi:four helix bundle protein